MALASDGAEALLKKMNYLCSNAFKGLLITSLLNSYSSGLMATNRGENVTVFTCLFLCVAEARAVVDSAL